MLLVLQTRKKPRFAESVYLNQLNLWKKFPGPADKLWRHSRSAITHHVKTAQVVQLGIGKLRQQVDHRGYEDGAGDALLCDGLTKICWCETWQCDLACAARRHRKHRGKVSDVEHRRSVQINAIVATLHPVVETVNIRQHVGMRQRHAFGPPRRAARINQG